MSSFDWAAFGAIAQAVAAIGTLALSIDREA
jgi:hypothetical protein